MRVAFFGTPSFAATVLQEMIGKQDIVVAITQPDAIRARGQEKLPSEVKTVAQAAGIHVLTPSKLRDEDFLAEFKSFNIDVICVASYGKIIPNSVLELPRYGSLNVHASLLPRWRGAAPIERAILEGDEFVGVSIMKVSEVLDSGDFCLSEAIAIEDKSAEQLRNELAHAGGKLLLQALRLIEDNTISWTKQDESLTTYAHKIERTELFLTPGDTSDQFIRKVRASAHNHPAKMRIADKGVIVEHARKITDSNILDNLVQLTCGQALFVTKRLFVATQDGIVEVEQVRPEGKNSMSAQSFMSGIQGSKGKVLQWGNYE